MKIKLIALIIMSITAFTYSTKALAVPGKLVSAEQTGKFNVQNLKKLISPFSKQTADKLKYDIVTYKITYTTVYKGETIKASGIAYVPEGTQTPLPLLSLQHGTTFSKNDVPSEKNILSGMEAFAAGGYITIMPDYIGYGISGDKEHPYYDREYSAAAVTDLIKATQEFLSHNDIAYTDELFLAGYSEGGYVTMAAHRAIEENPEWGLKVTASAAGAGAYDLESMAKNITTETSYSHPAYLAFILHSWNETYDWNRPMEDFINEEYAKHILKSDGQMTDGWLLNMKLTSDLSKLFNKDFIEGIKNGSEKDFVATLKNNSLKGWKPQAPIRLYHGTKDNVVPFSNSEDMVIHFKENGVENVELHPVNNGTHGTTLFPMATSFIKWFESFRAES